MRGRRTLREAPLRGIGWWEGCVVGPGLGALGVAEPALVAPEDVVPAGAAGLDAVFLDEMPDDPFEGDAAGGEVEAGEGAVLCVARRRRIYVEVAAWIARRRISVVLVDKDRLWVVNTMTGLVAVGRSKRLEAWRTTAMVVADAQGHLNIQIHPVGRLRRNTDMGISRHAVADDQLVGT